MYIYMDSHVKWKHNSLVKVNAGQLVNLFKVQIHVNL